MIKHLFFLLLSITFLFGGNHILHNDAILIEKAAQKIEKMCEELLQTTGVGVYISAVDTLDGKSIVQYGSDLAQKLNAPYVLLAIAVKDEQIDLTMSPDVANYLDKDEILDDFIIPILVSHNKKSTPQQMYSAAIFNGVAEMTDQIAAEHNIVLANSVGSQSKNFYEGIMWVIKLLMLITVAVLVYIYISSKRDAQ
jgi:uncharacterized membrane protein YgcG